jgi:hypothetical protein
MNHWRLAVVLGLMLVCALSAVADDTSQEAAAGDIPTVVEVTPAGIELVIGFNRIGEAMDRSEQLNEALGIVSQTDFRDEFDRFIGRGVVDFAGPAVIYALTGFETDTTDFTRLGACVFLQDPQSARATLGAEMELPDAQITGLKFGEPGFTMQGGFLERMLYAALGDDALRESFESPSLATELDPGVVDRLNAADILAIAKRGPMLDELWHGILPPAPVASEGAATDEEAQQLARQVQQLSQSIEWMTFAGNVALSDDTEPLPIGTRVGFSAICDHAADSESAALLEHLGNDNQPTTFTGLPAGDAVVAVAGKLDGSTHMGVVRYAADIAFQLWNSSHGLPDSLIGEQFLSTFEEAGEHLQGGRLAIYRNDDHAQHGRFAVVVIFDAEDPQAFLGDMRQLVRLANADEIAAADDAAPVTDDDIRALVTQLGDRTYRVRRSATNRLMLIGPRAVPFLQEGLEADSLELKTRARVILEQIEALNTFESRHFLGSDMFQNLEVEQRYIIAGEELADGAPVDLISTTITDEADQPFAQRLTSWLGPEWNRWRIAATDEHVVVVIGSRDDLLQQTMDNLNGTNVAQLETPAWQATERPHQFELHVDLRAFLPANTDADAQPPPATTTPGDLVSVGLAFARDTIHVDAFVPLGQLPVHGWPFGF